MMVVQPGSGQLRLPLAYAKLVTAASPGLGAKGTEVSRGMGCAAVDDGGSAQEWAMVRDGGVAGDGGMEWGDEGRMGRFDFFFPRSDA
jgi:hypothetical protein